MNHGLSLLVSRDTPAYMASLPVRIGVMAALLWVLQPEFDIGEVRQPHPLLPHPPLPYVISLAHFQLAGSVWVTLQDKAAYPEVLYLAAWSVPRVCLVSSSLMSSFCGCRKNLLTWLTLVSTTFALSQLTSSRLPFLTTASVSLLGVLAGFLCSIDVSPPLYGERITSSHTFHLSRSCSMPQALWAASSMPPCWEWEGHFVGVPTPPNTGAI